MSTPTKVFQSALFRKRVKEYGRPFPLVRREIVALVEQLEAGHKPGDLIPDIGYVTYKVRLANPSANRGKRGGFRALYYVHLEDEVGLVYLYSKTDEDNVSAAQVRFFIEQYLHEREQKEQDTDTTAQTNEQSDNTPAGRDER